MMKARVLGIGTWAAAFEEAERREHNRTCDMDGDGDRVSQLCT
jgi:hypothetical protein